GSSRGEGDEAALSGVDKGSCEPFAGQVDVAHDLAVDLDRSLGDQPPRLARRVEPEPLDQQSRAGEAGARRAARPTGPAGGAGRLPAAAPPAPPPEPGPRGPRA